jgi:hypothetical protein
VDGNVDSMIENPWVPGEIEPRPYWGPPDKMPKDREIHRGRILISERDAIELGDEITQWKADLEEKIKQAFSNKIIH